LGFLIVTSCSCCWNERRFPVQQCCWWWWCSCSTWSRWRRWSSCSCARRIRSTLTARCHL